LTTPDGTPYKGFKVSLGGSIDPSEIVRTYDDIKRILHNNKVEYRTHEEHKPDGTFKSFTIET